MTTKRERKGMKSEIKSITLTREFCLKLSNNDLFYCIIISCLWEFPSGSVIQARHFHCWGTGSIPGWGTKIQHAVSYRKKKKLFMGLYSFIRLKSSMNLYLFSTTYVSDTVLGAEAVNQVSSQSLRWSMGKTGISKDIHKRKGSHESRKQEDYGSRVEGEDDQGMLC